MTKIRKAKETMSAKERVLRTFAFEKTDRVPIDYATNGSIHHRLCVELGIPGDNYDLLLEALAACPTDTPITLTLVGSDHGGYTEQMQALSARLHLEDKVQFLGRRTDVPQLLQQADLFVHPAVWEEGFGITLIEAMASGVPCLAFPKGAIPEIIGPEIDGFLTEEVSAAALTAGINRALELFTKAPHHWHTLCKNARQKAELFSIERTVAQLEALYQEQ